MTHKVVSDTRIIEVNMTPDYVHPVLSIALEEKDRAICYRHDGGPMVIDVSGIPNASLRFDGMQLSFLYYGIDMPVACIVK